MSSQPHLGEEDLAIVTGGGSGIGRAVAIRLARDGRRVLAADLDLPAAEATAAQAGANVTAAAVDVRDEESVRALIDEAIRIGRVAALVNVAGVGSTTNAPDTPLEVWERVMAVNATGTFLCCKHVIPHMREHAGGAIVNIASVAGLVGMRNRAAYCASKGAVVALTRALALDHARDGIRINAVCPGTVDTPWVERLIVEAGETLDGLAARQPLGRLGSPEEVAGAVAWLLGPDATFATGSALVLDGGWTAG
ncbi:MAG TPA: SDR family oxidoreductase [Solirubrobacteraceae bacterium]|nr:SDR family oxidoreductase [Solirubrobacteraceae bacterium]